MIQYMEVFKEEAKELLEDLEISLLELENAPQNKDLIGRIFRAMHTIKGSGAMFGFEDVANFTHNLENIYDLVRHDKFLVTKELIDLTLQARDHIKELLNASENDETVDPAKSQKIIDSLKKLNPDSSSGKIEENTHELKDSGNDETLPPEGENITYYIQFQPAPNIFAIGTNPVLLLNELQELGECKVIARIDGIPLLEEIDPEVCYTSWEIFLTTTQGINSIRDVFIFVDDDCKIKVNVIDEGGIPETEENYKKLGEILVEHGDVEKEAVEIILEQQKPVGEMLVDAGLVESEKIQSALVEQQHVRSIRKQRKVTEAASSIRVASGKLDKLVNLVGELVTVQARLCQFAANKNDAEILSIAEEVERLTNELRDNTMSIRMLPIGTTFSKFKRVVRDLSNELGKMVVMKTDGAETELDKTVIEQLNDPLVHLIRNCIDHGIEKPKHRAALGKPAQGTVHLSATHSGANVLIRIQDDGAGLDSEAIRTKAIEKGIISEDAELPEKDIFALIFAAGFSTAENVSKVSGRGVGMDVVKKTIDALGGSVEIESQKDVGTTITLKLPLTLAIIEGLLVKISDAYFVFPLSTVEECIELTQQDVAKARGRNIINVRDEIVPYIRLREYFEINGELPAFEQIVITESDKHKVGFTVDQIIGEHQTVIKNLSKIYRNIEGLSGATILGDGTVALILDVPKLVHNAELEENKQKV